MFLKNGVVVGLYTNILHETSLKALEEVFDKTKVKKVTTKDLLKIVESIEVFIIKCPVLLLVQSLLLLIPVFL